LTGLRKGRLHREDHGNELVTQDTGKVCGNVPQTSKGGETPLIHDAYRRCLSTDYSLPPILALWGPLLQFVLGFLRVFSTFLRLIPAEFEFVF